VPRLEVASPEAVAGYLDLSLLALGLYTGLLP
jgi:hypothetical protein